MEVEEIESQQPVADARRHSSVGRLTNGIGCPADGRVPTSSALNPAPVRTVDKAGVSGFPALHAAETTLQG
jgi:hypothetical protein